MAIRSANVMARIEPDVKEQAEQIISQMGLTASTAINLFYHQIIQEQALPFRPSVMARRPASYAEMTREEFDERMSVGYAQAINGNARPAEDVFDDLLKELPNVRSV